MSDLDLWIRKSGCTFNGVPKGAILLFPKIKDYVPFGFKSNGTVLNCLSTDLIYIEAIEENASIPIGAIVGSYNSGAMAGWIRLDKDYTKALSTNNNNSHVCMVVLKDFGSSGDYYYLPRANNVYNNVYWFMYGFTTPVSAGLVSNSQDKRIFFTEDKDRTVNLKQSTGRKYTKGYYILNPNMRGDDGRLRSLHVHCGDACGAGRDWTVDTVRWSEGNSTWRRVFRFFRNESKIDEPLKYGEYIYITRDSISNRYMSDVAQYDRALSMFESTIYKRLYLSNETSSGWRFIALQLRLASDVNYRGEVKLGDKLYLFHSSFYFKIFLQDNYAVDVSNATPIVITDDPNWNG